MPSKTNGRRCRWPERARLNARQGVRYHLQASMDVRRPANHDAGAARRRHHGRNHVPRQYHHEGYLKIPRPATKPLPAAGSTTATWLAVDRAGRLRQDQDRNKDIIISGGENISASKSKSVLYRHPAVMVAAVVANQIPNGRNSTVALHRTARRRHTTVDIIIPLLRPPSPASGCRNHRLQRNPRNPRPARFRSLSWQAE